MANNLPPLDWNEVAPVLESLEADFEKMTWTFGLRSNTHVGAGMYAIVFVTEYNRLVERLDRAEKLLRSLRQITSLCEHDKRSIDGFFDPAPL